MTKFVPSPQQADFLEWCRTGTGSCVLEAVAGAGKTTTLLEAVDALRGQVAIMAYNKKIAQEIKERLEERGVDWKKAQAGTVHSFGFSALRKAFPGIRVDDRKVPDLFDELCPEGHELHSLKDPIVTLVGLAKQRALTARSGDQEWHDIVQHFEVLDEGDETSTVRVVAAARRLLLRSNERTDVCDFDDMVYLPLVHPVRFWTFDVVMVDEAQDTNPARRKLVARLLRRGGRVIAVGDRHQAIYGFTGADGNSLELIAAEFGCCRMPLTVTYRCPRAVVEMAQQWVSHIQAHESAPQGVVSAETMEQFLGRTDLSASSAVLCRLNAPLVALAFRLIAKGVGCRVEGRDIGVGLKKLAQRWKIKTTSALLERLENHLERQTARLTAQRKEAQLAVLEDQVETLRVIVAKLSGEGRHEVADVVAAIDAIFDDNPAGVLTLSSIHKSKGREWERVFWLDRAGTCPSPWARQAWQQEQEVNLCYVAATRAKRELVDLSK